jgi:hypothetical protein
MGRPCTICTHPARQAIDKALIGGASMGEIAAKFRVTADAAGRHNAAHLPVKLVQAAEHEELKQALDVLTQLKVINGAALQILSEARKSGDGELALKAIDRIHKQIELQARLLGELDDRAQINVLLAPEWLHIRAVVLTALEGHPEAKRAVAGSLATLEATSG